MVGLVNLLRRGTARRASEIKCRNRTQGLRGSPMDCTMVRSSTGGCSLNAKRCSSMDCDGCRKREVHSVDVEAMNSKSNSAGKNSLAQRMSKDVTRYRRVSACSPDAASLWVVVGVILRVLRTASRKREQLCSHHNSSKHVAHPSAQTTTCTGLENSYPGNPSSISFLQCAKYGATPPK